MELFCATLPGLEQVLLGELDALGLKGARVTPGGVQVQSDLEGLYQANLWLRTASAVSVRLGTFQAFNWKQLIKSTQKLPWQHWLKSDSPLSIHATCRKSKLYHSKGVEERVLEGICRALGQQVRTQEDQEEGLSVQVRLQRDRCTVSLNSSGAPLHKRGYRQQVGKAPLREHLAAATLILSGWSSPSAIAREGFLGFCDPMCGSGVFPIEAALIAKDIAPGLKRTFDFQKFANFDPELWKRCLAGALKRVNPTVSLRFDASDRNAGAIAMAQGNAERAGVLEDIFFSQNAVSSIATEQKRGLLCCNPPYGTRLSKNKDIRNLYARLGQVHQERFPNWDLSLITSRKELAASTKLRFKDISAPLPLGGIRVQLYRHRPLAR